jgi:SAM-dependent methyltransferase
MPISREKAPTTLDAARGERERLAYEQGVWEVSDGWHRKFLHVFSCPNTKRHDKQIQDWITLHGKGKRILDVGCGRGEISRRLLDAGAEYVLGIDISEHEIGFAKQFEVPGHLEFVVGSAEEPISGSFDVICGFSILHHLDYQSMLSRMYSDNLNPGGIIAFQEPLGESILTRAYKWRVRNAHTPDERSFMKKDLKWFRSTFPSVRIAAFGYFSYLFGIASTKFAKSADNFAMRICDGLDTTLATVPFMCHRFRRCNILIEKSDPSSSTFIEPVAATRAPL